MLVFLKLGAKGRPCAPVLCRKDADGTACDGLAGSLVGVGADGTEVEEDVAFGQKGTVFVVEDVEPV